MPPSDQQFQLIADVLRQHQTFLLVPHDRPDGDALGSMLALARALEKQGKTALPIILGGISERYQFLSTEKTPPILGKDISIDQIPVPDVIIVLDTGVRQQLLPIVPYLNRRPAPIVVIDHHAHGELNPDYALTDTQSPATGLIIAKLLEKLGWIDDPKIASLLLISIATDTGWFSYSNTNAECFDWAAKLISHGADAHGIYEKLFLTDSPQRYRLLAKTLASAELRANDQLVVLSLTRQDFLACQADQSHTENLIDQAGRLKSMRVAILCVEQTDGSVRISRRSRAPFDVHRFAAQFGGGGHHRAAGMKVQGDFNEVKNKIITQLESDIQNM